MLLLPPGKVPVSPRNASDARVIAERRAVSLPYGGPRNAREFAATDVAKKAAVPYAPSKIIPPRLSPNAPSPLVAGESAARYKTRPAPKIKSIAAGPVLPVLSQATTLA